MNKKFLFLLSLLVSACALNGMETDRLYEQLPDVQWPKEEAVLQWVRNHPRTISSAGIVLGAGLGVATRKFPRVQAVSGSVAAFYIAAFAADRSRSALVDRKLRYWADCTMLPFCIGVGQFGAHIARKNVVAAGVAGAVGGLYAAANLFRYPSSFECKKADFMYYK